MKKPNPAAAQAVAEANARLAESKQKALSEQVAEADVAPRATDKQRKAAETKAALKTGGKPKHESTGEDVTEKTPTKAEARRKNKERRDVEVPPASRQEREAKAHESLSKGFKATEEQKAEATKVLSGEDVPRETAPVEPTESAVDQPVIRPDKSGSYAGPMLALRQRLKAGVYTKSENGNPSCGDEVATILGKLSPAEVIHACLIAMALDTNPYLHLNVGQQSMNLRNKLRGKLKKGEFGMGVLREAVEEVVALRPAEPAAEPAAEQEDASEE